MEYLSKNDSDFEYIDKILEFLALKNNSTKKNEIKKILFSHFKKIDEREVKEIIGKCYVGETLEGKKIQEKIKYIDINKVKPFYKAIRESWETGDKLDEEIAKIVRDKQYMYIEISEDDKDFIQEFEGRYGYNPNIAWKIINLNLLETKLTIWHYFNKSGYNPKIFDLGIMCDEKGNFLANKLNLINENEDINIIINAIKNCIRHLDNILSNNQKRN